MTFIEAIRSAKPFRRPCWVEPNDEFQWVVYNEEDRDLDWALSDGKPSGNCFGCVTAGDQMADDFEVFEYPATGSDLNLAYKEIKDGPPLEAFEIEKNPFLKGGNE